LQVGYAFRLVILCSARRNFTADFVVHVLHFFIADGNVFSIFALKYHSSPLKTLKFQNRVTYDTTEEGVHFAKVFYAVHR
jgi:hypothetical protein